MKSARIISYEINFNGQWKWVVHKGILQIVEVSPSSTDELVPGTRLCAYWSQQYRCLYPGSVAEPGTPNPALDSKFVAVEFDDGDSGRIALEDIRLLPPDYPIIGMLNVYYEWRQFSEILMIFIKKNYIEVIKTAKLNQA